MSECPYERPVRIVRNADEICIADKRGFKFRNLDEAEAKWLVEVINNYEKLLDACKTAHPVLIDAAENYAQFNEDRASSFQTLAIIKVEKALAEAEKE